MSVLISQHFAGPAVHVLHRRAPRRFSTAYSGCRAFPIQCFLDCFLQYIPFSLYRWCESLCLLNFLLLVDDSSNGTAPVSGGISVRVNAGTARHCSMLVASVSMIAGFAQVNLEHLGSWCTAWLVILRLYTCWSRGNLLNCCTYR